MPIRYLLFTALLALLAGCSGLTPKETLEGSADPALWQVQKKRIGTLDSWQISGKVGVRTPQDSASATLFWLQRQDYYDIRLSGPLGRGAARLTGRPSDITLEVANQGSYQADSPEQLLSHYLNLRLPVSQLLWWVRGLPAPDSSSQLKLDNQGRLIQLAQDGWQIEYLRYAEHNGYELPERFKLHGQDIELTLVIKEWHPRQLGQ